MTEPLDGFVDRQRRAKPNDARSSLGDLEDVDVEIVGNANGATRLQFAARMHERLVAITAERLEQKDLGLAARVARAEQPSAKHARGVEGEHVARRDQLSDVGESDGARSFPLARSTTISRL